jgi:hypothetical protein
MHAWRFSRSGYRVAFAIPGRSVAPLWTPRFRSTFPRRIDSAATVLAFETGWIFFDEHDRVLDVNGYAMVTADGRELAVYHLWGQ